MYNRENKPQKLSFPDLLLKIFLKKILYNAQSQAYT